MELMSLVVSPCNVAVIGAIWGTEFAVADANANVSDDPAVVFVLSDFFFPQEIIATLKTEAAQTKNESLMRYLLICEKNSTFRVPVLSCD
jgi:hypothetical protein